MGAPAEPGRVLFLAEQSDREETERRRLKDFDDEFPGRQIL